MILSEQTKTIYDQGKMPHMSSSTSGSGKGWRGITVRKCCTAIVGPVPRVATLRTNKIHNLRAPIWSVG